MEMQNSIEEVRGTKVSNVNGRIAVIVSIEYDKGKGCFGVQFWTPAMIEKGVSTNTDGTESKFVELLNINQMKMVITGTIFFNENSGAEIHIVDEYKHCVNDAQVEEIVSEADVHGVDWIIVENYSLPIRTSVNVPLLLVDYLNTRNKQKGFINL